MTNKIAVAIALMVLALFALDALFFDGHLPLFLARKTLALIEWVAFWR